jgi:peroxiredoxin
MEIPELNGLVEKYKDNKDIIFLGLATNKKPQLETFLKKQAFNYNIVPETRKVAAAYGISGYPTHIVIGKKGKITFGTTGLSPTPVHNLENAIKSSL